MSTTEYTIVTLEPMRVASAWSFGEQPEEAAWAKLRAWAEPRGLLTGPSTGRIFGFNHPSPSVGSPNYGYEFQLEVSPDVAPTDDIAIKERPGGRYAVLAFHDQGGNLYETIPAAWQQLDNLVVDSGQRQGAHQWLEEHSSAGKLIALYYPLAEG